MNEYNKLIMRAEKYIHSAGVLMAEKDYESSVSRSYYAMFYVAEALLLSKDMTYNSHKGVIIGFSEHFIKTGIFPKEMGKNLGAAFEKRQIGDYKSSFILSCDDAQNILVNCIDFVSRGKQLLSKNGFLG